MWPKTVRKNQIELEPVQTFDFQEYLIKFEKVIEEYEIKLFDILTVDKEILFNSFVKEMNSLDTARYFIAMLYLAMKGKVGISCGKPMEGKTSEHDTEDPFSIDGTNFRSIENMEFIKITVIDS